MTVEDLDEKTRRNILWDLSPQDAAFKGVEIKDEEDIKKVKKVLEERVGRFYFYISVWNCQASLMLAEEKPDWSVTSTEIEGVPNNLLEDAVYEQGGALNISGQYAISEEIEDWLRKKVKS